MTGEANPAYPLSDRDLRSRKIQQVTLVAIVTNFTLSVLQLVVGIMSNAFSLVVDAAHTFSDLLSDGLVLLAARKGSDPADDDHPYGHERFETVVSLFLGLALLGVGVGFLWSAGARVQSADALPPLHPIALWMAVFTLVAKEVLFRFTMAASRRLSSRMLEANAWHARTDAASSLVVAIGIGGGLLGYRFVEPLAAALVGFMILRMGLSLAYAAIRELVDTAVSKELVVRIARTIDETPGVLNGHELRTRRMAHRVLCDAHVQVDPRITVSEGHYIAESVRRRVCGAHADVQDVLVHVDAEDDLEEHLELPMTKVPDRKTLVARAREAVGDALPAPDRVLVHYLGGRVEIEMFYPLDRVENIADREALGDRIRAALTRWPEIRSLKVHGTLAP
ncbi:cation transporter [Nitrogeniibacter mangrovi]|uniref:Cation transporter n=1 Tax=Nitrogeniibacter mangrovi TaxID=2016596 RepID=A0A6C1B957_9RHOO|nr:cation diffusion facilitator family transporter [Nitrogeniibacter mangrovi]QID18870.1 cation transporter [Nitrogeniibacter mangrovi]